MVLDHATVNPEPFKRIGAYQTSDGKVHVTIEDAYAYERSRAIMEYAQERSTTDYQAGRFGGQYEQDFNELVNTAKRFNEVYKFLLDKGLVK